MKRLIVLFVLLLLRNVYAVDYYVDAIDGDDSDTGQVGHPWRTISKVNSETFLPRDTISFKRGQVWREGIVFPSSGTVSYPIRIRDYGDPNDAPPEINGAVILDEIFQVPGDGDVGNDDFESPSRPSFWSLQENFARVEWAEAGEPNGPSGGETYGAKIDAVGQAGYLLLDLGAAGRSEIWLEVDIRSLPLTVPDKDRCVIFEVTDVNDDAIIQVRFEGTNRGIYFRNLKTLSSTNGAWIIGNPGDSGSVWHTLKLRFVIDTWSSNYNYGVLQGWYDDNLEFTLNTGSLSNFGSEKMRYVYLGKCSDSSSEDILYADNFRYSYAPFDVGTGLYTQAVLGSITNSTSRIYVDEQDMGDAESDIADVDAEGKWYVDDVNDHYYLYDDVLSSTVEVPVRNPLHFNKKDFINVENLTLKRAKNSLVGTSSSILAENMSIGCSLTNCVLHQSVGSGVSVSGDVQNFIVEDCEISECHHAGIFTNGITWGGQIPSSIFICNNKIHACYRQGIALEKISTCFIENNLIYNILLDKDNFARGLDITTAWGDIFDGIVVVKNNVVYGIEGRDDDSDEKQACCIIWDGTTYKGDPWEVSSSYEDIDFVTNDGRYYCCARDHTSSLDNEPGVGDEWGKYWRRLNPGNLIMENNIFYGTDEDAAVIFYELYYYKKLVRMDYNCYWSDSPTAYIFRFVNNTYKRSDFSSFQSAVQQEEHGMFADPLFVDSANYDFRLQPLSPCPNAGPTPYSFHLAADINRDRIVNMKDFAVLASQWLQSDD